MRSGRGKCPQCKEIITVDLDAQEIRCPLCNALLKKSAKTVAEVRAEEEARRAALAPETIPTEEQKKVAAEETRTEEVAEQAAPAKVSAVEEASVEEAAPATEKAAEEEVAPEAIPDEIGISDEELAMMDEAPAEEIAEEAAPAAQEDEIGISDEELAMMDEGESAFLSNEESSAEESAAPIVSESISAEAEDLTPEEKAEEEETASPTTEESEAVEEDAAEHDNVNLSDDDLGADFDDSMLIPAEEIATEEAPADEATTEAIPVEENAEEALAEESSEAASAEESSTEEAPAEENAEESAEDALVPTAYAAMSSTNDENGALLNDIPAEDTLTEEIPVEENAEKTSAEESVEVARAEEVSTEEIPTEEALVIGEQSSELMPEDAPSEELSIEDSSSTTLADEAAPAEDVYVPTEEDMAFAASLSDTGRHSYVAPTSNAGKTAKQAERNYRAKPEKADSVGEHIYHKVVAILMIVFSFLAAAFYFLYINPEFLISISEKTLKVIEKLPTFGGEKFAIAYAPLIFYGLILVISALGITGKKGKVGFILVLVADVVNMATIALPAFLSVDAILKILNDYGKYISYGIDALLLAGGVAFLVSFVKDRAEYGISGLLSIPAIVYAALLLLGTIFLALQPRLLPDLKIPTELWRYLPLGIWGAAVLLTLVGVHNGAASRSGNVWLATLSLLCLALTAVAGIVFDLLDMADEVFGVASVYSMYAPALPLIGTMGLAASDLRN